MKTADETTVIQPVTLKAEPDPLQIDLTRTAILVIDMQNCFVSKGGMFDLRGANISETPTIIETVNKVTRAQRAMGGRVIHVVHYHSHDLRETGGPNAGYWHKVARLGFDKKPEWIDKCFVRGTWGAEIAKGLEIHEDDILVVKPRFSAFFGTDLDTILKTFNIKYLATAGVATNICVEATIRDACHLDYFPILISDATAPAGPPFLKDATIHNVTACFGWVTNSLNLLKVLK
ncbi:cysteine hydrolase family protein [Thermodesulfobacteriota bacterium]